MSDFVGIWKLVRVRAFDAEGKEVEPALGPEPMGVVQMTANRIVGVTADGRAEMPPGLSQRTYGSYTAVYPEAHVSIDEKGIVLRPSRPAIGHG